MLTVLTGPGEHRLKGGKLLSRRQAEGASAKHGGRKAIHDRLCLDVSVSVHFVAAPAADQANDVAVDTGAEEGHGAAGPSGTDRHV